MSNGFLRVKDRDFYLNDRKMILRGFGLGSWLNLEHFMLGIPGTDSQIRSAVVNAYGPGQAERFWRKFYHSFINEDDFEFLKRLGINTLRIPFNYRLFEDDQKPYMYREEGFWEIDRILRLCEHYELYAVLDLHAAPGGQSPDWHCDNATGESLFWEYADFRKRVISLWKHIANRYASNNWIAAYDLLNEPVLMIKDNTILNQFFVDLVTEIRSVDKNHLLFVEGDSYATRFEDFEPFADPNLACSFHCYPFMYLNEFSGKNQKESIEKILFEKISLKDIQERLKRPLWCGETGALFNHGDRRQHESLLQDTLEIFEKNNMSWSLWTYKDARSMSMMHPKENSPWMHFAKCAGQKWNFWEEFRLRDNYVEDLIKQYNLAVPELDKLRIGFRILANQQLVLKETYTEIFKNIPFETFLTYPDSFLYKNCELWQPIANLVTNLTQPNND